MGLLKSLALKSNFHFIIKDYKSYSLLFFKLIYLVVCLYFLLFLLKIIYQNQHNIIQGLIGGEIIENKYLIALILIIILAFIVAFAGLVLATNHSNEKTAINASSINDSDNETVAPVTVTSSNDGSNLDDSEYEEDTGLYDDSDTYDNTYDYTYDDTYEEDYDYLDEDYDDYEDDY